MSFTDSNIVTQTANILQRPNWMTTQRCSLAGCIPCDKRINTTTQDGCLVRSAHRQYNSCTRKGRDGKWRYSSQFCGRDKRGKYRQFTQFRFDSLADSDMVYTSATMTLKCVKNEKILVHTEISAVSPSEVTIPKTGEQLRAGLPTNAEFFLYLNGGGRGRTTTGDRR